VGVYEAVGNLSGRQRLEQAPVLLGHHEGVPVAPFICAQGLGRERSLQLIFDGASVELTGNVDQTSWVSADCLVILVGLLQQLDEPSSALSLRRGVDHLQGVALLLTLGLNHCVYDIPG
jgi:hypothetical protein